jgi:hypothetical protein
VSLGSTDIGEDAFPSNTGGVPSSQWPLAGTQYNQAATNTFALPGYYQATFDTSLRAILGLPTSASLTTATNSPNAVYIYMNAPTGDSGSDPAGLFTRMFNNTLRKQAGTIPVFGLQFTPAADTSTTGTNFVQPTRLDGDINSSAKLVDVFHAGREAIVIFDQDNHLWGTTTQDGITYSNNNGKPNPQLVDNNLSDTFVNIQKTYIAVRVLDSSCNDLHGSTIFFVKDDTDKSQRLFAREIQ